MLRLFIRVLVVNMYQMGLVWLCGSPMRPLQAFQTTSDRGPCVGMEPRREAFLPRGVTPRSGVQLPWDPHRRVLASCPWAPSLPTWEDWSSMTMYFFCHEMATTPLFCSFSRSGSPWVRAHLFSRTHSFSARNWQGDLKTYISFFPFFHSTPHLVLNTYMSCYEYV